MKQRVLFVTNFSAAAQNALTYACRLLNRDLYEFILVHIYRLPQTYTYEGVALASISDVFRDIEDDLRSELNRVHGEFPGITIHAQYIVGGLVESTRELIASLDPEILIFGTAGYYSEVWHTDSELLLALRNITIPVMIIPQHVNFHPLKQIGFACDYKNVCVPKQINFIRDLVRETGAQLNVVHVTSAKPDNDLMKKNESLLQEKLHDIQPSYFSIANSDVVKAIDQFVRQHNVDMLIVIPRKQEFWYSLFHKSNIDKLAFLNRLPLLRLPE